MRHLFIVGIAVSFLVGLYRGTPRDKVAPTDLAATIQTGPADGGTFEGPGTSARHLDNTSP